MTSPKTRAALKKARAAQEQAVQDAAELVSVLRKENGTLRRKLASHGARGELLMEAITDAFADYTPPRIPKPPPFAAKDEIEEAMLHVSDTQIGKVTKSYSTSIAAERLMELAERTVTCIRRHRTYANVKKIHVYLGGDMVEGELIFPGQSHSIDSSVLEQAVRTAPDMLARMILYIAANVPEVNVVCVCGNHGRPASKHAGSHPLTNWDRVCYEVIRLIVLGPQAAEREDTKGRVKFHIADDFYAVNKVSGHPHLLVHGDQIRGGFGGFPWYGASRKAQGWIDSIREPWEALYFGHFHTLAEATLNLRRWYCNGTTESDNEYAQEQLAACGMPVQRLQFWNEKHGMVADRPLYLKSGL